MCMNAEGLGITVKPDLSLVLRSIPVAMSRRDLVTGMVLHEAGHQQSNRSDAALPIEALEKDQPVRRGGFTGGRQQGGADLRSLARPGVEDNAVCARTANLGHGASGQPSFGCRFGGQCPAKEADHLALVVRDAPEVAAIDLSRQDTRPRAKLKRGEGWPCHEVTDGQAQRCGGALRPEDVALHALCPAARRFSS